MLVCPCRVIRAAIDTDRPVGNTVTSDRGSEKQSLRQQVISDGH